MPSKSDRAAVRQEARSALALIHENVDVRSETILDLLALVLELGLPSRAERERILNERANAR